MKCKIYVYLINELFSKKIADEQHHGLESADNKKYQWEDELEINSNVIEVKELENSIYSLKGILPSGNEFNELVQAMRLLTIVSDDSPDCQIGVSESILDRLEVNKNENEISICLFIKDNEPLSNPIPGIYIASKEFPKKLIF